MAHNTASFTSWFNNIKADDIDGGLAADFDGSLSGLGVELGSTTYNMSEALLALPVFKQETFEHGLTKLLDEGRVTLQRNGYSEHEGLITAPSPEHSPTTPDLPFVYGSVPVQRFTYILGASTSPATKVNEETLTYLNQGQSYEVKLKRLGQLGDLRGKLLKSKVRVIFHERRLQYTEREQLDTWKSTRPGERILDIDIPLSYGICDVVVDSQGLNTLEFVWDPNREVGVYCKVNCISTEFTAKKHGGEKGVPFRLQVETYSKESDGTFKLLHCASCQVKVFKPKGADRKNKTDREKIEKRSAADKEKYQPSYECTVLTEIPTDQVENYLEQLHKQLEQKVEVEPSADKTNPPKQQQQQQQQRQIQRTIASTSEGHKIVTIQPKKPASSEAAASASANVELKSPLKSSTASASPLKSMSAGEMGSPSASPKTPTSNVLSAGQGSSDSGVRNFGCLSPDISDMSAESVSEDSNSLMKTKIVKRVIKYSGSSPNLVTQPIVRIPKQSPVKPVAATIVEKSPQMEPLLITASAKEVAQWLQLNRFSTFVRVFQNFSGADLLRLSRDDLIQICGLADGIRLNNALQAKALRPKLTVYVCQLSGKSKSAQHHLQQQLSSNHSTPSPSTSPSTSLLLQHNPAATPSGVVTPITISSTQHQQQQHASYISPAHFIAPESSAEQYAAQLRLLEELMAAAVASGSGSARGGNTSPSTVNEGEEMKTAPVAIPGAQISASSPSPPVLVQSAPGTFTILTTNSQSSPIVTTSDGTRVIMSAMPQGHQQQPNRPKGGGAGGGGMAVKLAMSSKRQYRESNDEDEDDENVFYSKKQRTRNLELSRKGVYHALYLDHLTVIDLKEKIATLFSIMTPQVKEIYVHGPLGIHVLVTDDVVQNFTDNTQYIIEAIQEEDSSGVSPEYFVYLRSSKNIDA